MTGPKLPGIVQVNPNGPTQSVKKLETKNTQKSQNEQNVSNQAKNNQSVFERKQTENTLTGTVKQAPENEEHKLDIKQ